jgi:tRNA dimethylallyltransferase
LLIVTGPTSVGKTELVLKLSQHVPSEIINVDVGQFYTPLTIGTAKPNWKDQPVKHHLFDIIDSPKNITVVEYRNLVLAKINEIKERKKLPILVGGSGFYIKSLLFPPVVEVENVGTIETSTKDLWQKLFEIDPKRAEKINKNDIYRLQRALQIWKTTKIKPSDYVPIYNPPCDYSLIILIREKEDLYEKINIRVVQMLNQGWIQEVEKLQNSEWVQFLKNKKLIGYDDILLFLESECDKDEQLLISTIQKKVRNYAKRQLTFFKMLTKKITDAECEKSKNHCFAKKIIWCNLTLLDLDLYIKQLLKNL